MMTRWTNGSGRVASPDFQRPSGIFRLDEKCLECAFASSQPGYGDAKRAATYR